MSSLFPLGVASGEAFYDRESERKQLRLFIENGRHTVLIAPRRFGKTSLLRYVVEENSYPYCWLDLMTLSSAHDLQTKLQEHVAALIVTMGKTEKRIKLLAKKYLAALRPEISIDLFSVIKLNFYPDVNKEQDVVDLLLALNQVAKDLDQRAVLIFDEFQEIEQLDKDSSLQASIRHAAERATNVTYLFSGSKHRSLRRLFNGRQNPLYELCEQMPLTLISAEYYKEYLCKAAHQRWNRTLDSEVVERILLYTNCYPKYVNALCARLWLEESLPSLEGVGNAWRDFIFSRKDGIRAELENLRLNERKLLRYLSTHPTKAPFSQSFLVSVGLSQGSVQRCLELLQEKSLVVYDGECYRVIDPSYAYYFEMF